jgi:hypothetical protein
MSLMAAGDGIVNAQRSHCRSAQEFNAAALSVPRRWFRPLSGAFAPKPSPMLAWARLWIGRLSNRIIHNRGRPTADAKHGEDQCQLGAHALCWCQPQNWRCAPDCLFKTPFRLI